MILPSLLQRLPTCHAGLHGVRPPPPTTTRGGDFQTTFARVKMGDVLLCYVKAPAKRRVGALRVEGPMFLDIDDPVWGKEDDGSVRFPARFNVSPIIVRDVECGVPVEETIGVLDCLKPEAWSGLFMDSDTRLLRNVSPAAVRDYAEEVTPSA